MKVVAIHQIVHGAGVIAQPGTAFEIDGADLEALLAASAVREPTEAEAALWGPPAIEEGEAPSKTPARGGKKASAKEAAVEVETETEVEVETEAGAEAEAEDLL